MLYGTGSSPLRFSSPMSFVPHLHVRDLCVAAAATGGMAPSVCVYLYIYRYVRTHVLMDLHLRSEIMQSSRRNTRSPACLHPSRYAVEFSAKRIRNGLGPRRERMLWANPTKIQIQNVNYSLRAFKGKTANYTLGSLASKAGVANPAISRKLKESLKSERSKFKFKSVACTCCLLSCIWFGPHYAFKCNQLLIGSSPLVWETQTL